MAPGGRLLIADFAPHKEEFLRDEFAHRRLGFASGEVSEWLAEAGLKPARVRHLRGKALTVSIWSAVRPAAMTLASDRRRRASEPMRRDATAKRDIARGEAAS